MRYKYFKKIKKFTPIALAVLMIVIVGSLNVYYLERDKDLVIEGILKDGLPSLVAIVLISLLLELTSRKQDRNRIRDNFQTILQNQVGFNKYVSDYDEIGEGIEKMVSNLHEYEICKVCILTVGAEQIMIRGIINSLKKIQSRNVEIELLLLNPDSDLAGLRGSLINQEQYQMDILSNLSSITSYFNSLDEDEEFTKSNLSIRLYKSASKNNEPSCLPSIVMAKFDEEFIAYSPLWNSDNVKNGPLCFVPSGNKIFDRLSKEYEVAKCNSVAHNS